MKFLKYFTTIIQKLDGKMKCYLGSYFESSIQLVN